MATLRVLNLGTDVTVQTLKAEFSKYGKISSVVIEDRLSCAYIQFSNANHSQEAIWGTNAWGVELVYQSKEGDELWKYGVHGWIKTWPGYYGKTFDQKRRIGKGADGQVFECLSKTDNSTCAIKVVKKSELSTKYLEDFKRQVLMTKRLHHPNVIRFNESWIEEGVEELCLTNTSSDSNSNSNSVSKSKSEVSHSLESEQSPLESDLDIPETFIDANGYTLYRAMEYCPSTLKSKIKEGLTLETCMDYAHQIVEAVGHLHSKHVIHCDIWPENILIDSCGKIKIADFGSAIDFDEGGKIVAHQLNLGHASYRAPEMKENSEINEKVDIFSVGMVFLEMLRGGKKVLDSLRPLLDPDPLHRFSAEDVIREGLVSTTFVS